MRNGEGRGCGCFRPSAGVDSSRTSPVMQPNRAGLKTQKLAAASHALNGAHEAPFLALSSGQRDCVGVPLRHLPIALALVAGDPDVLGPRLQRR